MASADEFIKNVRRDFRTRGTNPLTRTRNAKEVEFVNEFTELFITGQVKDTEFIILQDVKNYLIQLPNNPFGLKHGQANAQVQSDMRGLCIKGAPVDGKQIKLAAKSLSENRVTFYNPLVAATLIAKAKGKERLEREARLTVLKQLPDREGYRQM